MKRRFFALLLALFLSLPLLCAAVPAGAEAVGIYDYAVVSGTSKLNLRSGPASSERLLGSLPEGGWAGLIGENGNWYFVYVPSLNQYGYMSKKYLKTEDGGAAASGTGVVNNPKATQFLNLRQYPSMDAPVLGIYYNGATFTVLSYGDGWYQVRLPDNTGYFRQEYVLVNQGTSGGTAYVRTSNGGKLNLRSAPSYTDSTILGQYAAGTPVTVLLRGKSSGGSAFWKVNVQGTVGYMDSAYLSASSSYYAPTATPAQPVSGQGTAVVNNPKSSQYLNLREQPSANARVLGQYKNGVRFQVLAPGETWCKVYGAASGLTGYMMTKYLRLSGVSAHPTKQVVNGSSYVNLRTAPSQISGSVAQRVPSGSTVTILTPGDEWCQVRYGSVTGYMMTYFLR